MWQFAEAVRGLADACQTLGVPVTGETSASTTRPMQRPSIRPRLSAFSVCSMTSRCERRWASGARATSYLLGTTRDEFGGSEWANVVHGHLGGQPPAVDLEAERALASILISAARDGLRQPPTMRRTACGAGAGRPACAADAASRSPCRTVSMPSCGSSLSQQRAPSWQCRRQPRPASCRCAATTTGSSRGWRSSAGRAWPSTGSSRYRSTSCVRPGRRRAGAL